MMNLGVNASSHTVRGNSADGASESEKYCAERMMTFPHLRSIARLNVYKVWLAPELLRNGDSTESYSRPGDVYAFAIIIHTVFYQYQPFGIEHLTPDVIVSRVKSRVKRHHFVQAYIVSPRIFFLLISG
nr:hormone receptor 83 [Hymenolepis microstoma]